MTKILRCNAIELNVHIDKINVITNNNAVLTVNSTLLINLLFDSTESYILLYSNNKSFTHSNKKRSYYFTYIL